MAKFTRSNGPVYRAERDQIEVTSLSPKPDPSWRYVDHAGHEHDYTWQLLVHKQDDPDEPPFFFDEDGEEYNAPAHLECKFCGEWIDPAMTGPSAFREFVPGEIRYYCDDVLISREEFEAAVREQYASRPEPSE